ncbi:hypothetical protein ACQPXH_01155 [Nocardia sp. CA-135953]|uniref:hypothetical protein n=1 Tax=Nocardia sp. CA-135953 TaxID=3239978 RepID=UPI003D9662CE
MYAGLGRVEAIQQSEREHTRLTDTTPSPSDMEFEIEADLAETEIEFEIEINLEEELDDVDPERLQRLLDEHAREFIEDGIQRAKDSGEI